MYPYTKEIDLGQAISLKEISKTKAEGFLVYCDHSDGIHNIEDVDFNYIYSQVKGKFFCDALTYATHILKQKTPPEGWGYAAYELSSGRYEGLECLALSVDNLWSEGTYTFDADWKMDWRSIAFRLTDLARVEADKPFDLPKQEKPLGYNSAYTPPIEEKTDTDKTEINAAQVIWMYKNYAKTIHWQNGTEWECFGSEDLENSITDKYELLTSTYNALPQEFKDLSAPIPPSGIRPPVTDWEAKYKELERATTSTLNTSHGQRSFSDYVNGYCKQLDLADRVAELEAKNKELKETKDPFEEQFEQIAANQKLNRLHSKIEWQNQIIEKYSELIELYKQQGR